jgi:pimeloyl-ACP methyl ester carboxylesterase
MLTVRFPVFLLLLGVSAFSATWCTEPEKGCLEGVPVENGQALFVYRSRPLTSADNTVRRVFILVHGVGRNGNDYFRYAVAATQDAREMDRTLVIAPRFHSSGGGTCKDELDPGEISFYCRGWTDGTRGGEVRISSFTAMDALLRAVSDKSRFPSLVEVVLAGHSAGGQFVQRYLGANRVDGKLPVPVRYIVANPSSYMYLDAWRPYPEIARSCPGYNQYKFGLLDVQGYASETGADAIRRNYIERDVTYLLGLEDKVDANSMDKTCYAMAQGPFRLQRGQAFFKHLTETTRAKHKLVEVPNCDHNAECMYRSPNGRKAVFPE